MTGGLLTQAADSGQIQIVSVAEVRIIMPIVIDTMTLAWLFLMWDCNEGIAECNGGMRGEADSSRAKVVERRSRRRT